MAVECPRGRVPRTEGGEPRMTNVSTRTSARTFVPGLAGSFSMPGAAVPSAWRVRPCPCRRPMPQPMSARPVSPQPHQPLLRSTRPFQLSRPSSPPLRPQRSSTRSRRPLPAPPAMAPPAMARPAMARPAMAPLRGPHSGDPRFEKTLRPALQAAEPSPGSAAFLLRESRRRTAAPPLLKLRPQSCTATTKDPPECQTSPRGSSPRQVARIADDPAAIGPMTS